MVIHEGSGGSAEILVIGMIVNWLYQSLIKNTKNQGDRSIRMKAFGAHALDELLVIRFND